MREQANCSKCHNPGWISDHKSRRSTDMQPVYVSDRGEPALSGWYHPSCRPFVDWRDHAINSRIDVLKAEKSERGSMMRVALDPGSNRDDRVALFGYLKQLAGGIGGSFNENA